MTIANTHTQIIETYKLYGSITKTADALGLERRQVGRHVNRNVKSCPHCQNIPHAVKIKKTELIFARIGYDLHQKLKALAEAQSCQMAQLIRNALEKEYAGC